jgi:hypothetical protein
MLGNISGKMRFFRIDRIWPDFEWINQERIALGAIILPTHESASLNLQH